MADLLIEAGAAATRRDSEGIFPLLVALGYYDGPEYERSKPPNVSLPLIQPLLEKGGDPEQPSSGSALDLARETRDAQLIGLIEEFTD